MKPAVFIVLSTLAVCSISQRSPYAGRNPIGYPEMERITTSTTESNELDNRFGEDDTRRSTTSTTTERLPLEANGDRDLVNRLRKLPLDRQPFWLINWLALEEQRQNPQTYQQQPNSFIDNFPSRSSENQESQFFF